MSYICGEVSWNPGQHGGPPTSLMPISMCGAEEMPTSPQPTSAIGCPAVTCVPTGTSAGAACP